MLPLLPMLSSPPGGQATVKLTCQRDAKVSGQKNFLEILRVEQDETDPAQGTLTAGNRQYRVALGRTGISAEKKEGDGASPAGIWPLRRIFYRADHVDQPETGLPAQRIAPLDGWSDDPADPDYNRLVSHPETGKRALSAEHMWREDALYDVVIVVGHNDDPPVPGHGSAIFMHLARDGYKPTEGCVAMAREDMLELVRHIGPDTRLEIVLPESPA